MSQDRPLGPQINDWTPPARPDGLHLIGGFAELAPLKVEPHGPALFRAFSGHDWIWDYMPLEPFSSQAAFHRWVAEAEASSDPVFFAVKNLETGKWEGFLSLLRITPEHGVIEVGFVTFSPALQNTRASTEAQYLLMKWAFEAGYRRYEWKCNALNAPSRRTAQRLGFSFEGVFRKHMIVKNRNRDTAWFSVIDSEWPALKEAYAAWLAPSNFDSAGQQIERLSDLTRLVRAGSDPSL